MVALLGINTTKRKVMFTKMGNRAEQSGLNLLLICRLFDQLCLPVKTVLHTAKCVRRMRKYKEWERQDNVKEVGMFERKNDIPILCSKCCGGKW